MNMPSKAAKVKYNLLYHYIVLFSSHSVIYRKLRKIFYHFGICNNMDIYGIMYTTASIHFF